MKGSKRVQNKGSKGSKKGSKSGLQHPTLTKTEKEILHYLTNELLTPKQIATRRKCSKSAIYKHIRNLKKKGAINKNYQRVQNFERTLTPKDRIRLHGLELNIKILYLDDRYKRYRSEKNGIYYHDGNTILLYRNSLEVYLVKSFFGETAQSATRKAFEYINRLLMFLENDLDVILVKARNNNVRLVNAHYSEVGNALAREVNDKSEKIRVYAREDGKLWFMIDNSFNLHEAETVHPETAKVDMEEVVRPFFQDLRDQFLSEGRPVVFSDLKSLVAEILSNQKTFADNLASHVEAVKSLSDMSKDIRSLVGGRKKVKGLDWFYNNISSLEDVFKFENEIKSLSNKEKAELSKWIFSLGA